MKTKVERKQKRTIPDFALSAVEVASMSDDVADSLNGGEEDTDRQEREEWLSDLWSGRITADYIDDGEVWA